MDPLECSSSPTPGEAWRCTHPSRLTLTASSLAWLEPGTVALLGRCVSMFSCLCRPRCSRWRSRPRSAEPARARLDRPACPAQRERQSAARVTDAASGDAQCGSCSSIHATVAMQWSTATARRPCRRRRPGRPCFRPARQDEPDARHWRALGVPRPSGTRRCGASTAGMLSWAEPRLRVGPGSLRSARERRRRLEGLPHRGGLPRHRRQTRGTSSSSSRLTRPARGGCRRRWSPAPGRSPIRWRKGAG